MAKRILTLCLALIIGIAFAMPASAALKSVKVGGDATIRMILRDNLDFLKDTGDESEAWIMSSIRLAIGAELTDNVSVMVRLINERDWGKSYVQTAAGAGGAVGLPLDTSDDIKLDIAYVKLGDILMPGLSATLGRQEILLGKGFVMGNASGLLPAVTANTAIRASDLTARKSFDAWRLDKECAAMPLTLTFFDAKIIEESANALLAGIGGGSPVIFSGNDVDLWGLNAAYKLDNVVFEGYVLNLNANLPGDNIDIWTIGARVDHNVLAAPGLNYNLELAWQTGEFITLDQGALAGMADVSYTVPNSYSPKFGASWTYYGGDDDLGDNNQEFWVPLFPDNQADRVGCIGYASTLGLAATDLSVPKLYASFKPTEKTLISAAWFPATTLNTNPIPGGDTDLGFEVDLGYNYKVTDDVSFGLLAAYAQAEDIAGIGPGWDDTAIEVIGTVAVSF